MPKPIQLDEPCEVCGKNEFWDNRASKKSPKAPDFRCANKECAGKDGYPVGRWLPKGQKPKEAHQEPAGAPKGGRLTPDDTTPDERGERVYTWQGLAHTYAVLTKAVVKGMLDAGLGEVVLATDDTPRMVKLDQSAVQAGVATLLIQGEKAHIPLLHPRKPAKDEVAKPAPKVEAKPEPVPAPVEDEEWESIMGGGK